MISEKQKTVLIDAINTASTNWQTAFNSGDAVSCAAQYKNNAVMHARPFATFTGTNEIQTFWQNLINDGFSDVEYIEPNIEALDETSVVLTSAWKMNKAHGVIYRELWVLQNDGSTMLRIDDFEAQG